jgi:hypothetical protein
MESHLELKRAAWRPTDASRSLIRKKDVRDEAQWETDDADIENQRVEQKQTNDASASSWNFAQSEMRQRQKHAQQGDDNADHSGASALAACFAVASRTSRSPGISST